MSDEVEFVPAGTQIIEVSNISYDAISQWNNLNKLRGKTFVPTQREYYRMIEVLEMGNSVSSIQFQTRHRKRKLVTGLDYLKELVHISLHPSHQYKPRSEEE